VFSFTFPDYAHSPAEFPELAGIFYIPALVACELRAPILAPGLWNMGVDAAGVLVPKTAPYFDNAFQSGEYKIGLAGKRRQMEPVMLAHALNQTPIARRTRIRNSWSHCQSKVRLRAPSLHTEQIAVSFDDSSLPPMDLSTMRPM
jgi:hypothetical protein